MVYEKHDIVSNLENAAKYNDRDLFSSLFGYEIRRVLATSKDKLRKVLSDVGIDISKNSSNRKYAVAIVDNLKNSKLVSGIWTILSDKNKESGFTGNLNDASQKRWAHAINRFYSSLDGEAKNDLVNKIVTEKSSPINIPWKFIISMSIISGAAYGIFYFYKKLNK